MSFCRNCGNEIVEDHEFCNECGHRRIELSYKDLIRIKQQKDELKGKQKKPKKLRLVEYTIFFTLLSILIILLSLYLYGYVTEDQYFFDLVGYFCYVFLVLILVLLICIYIRYNIISKRLWEE